MNYPKLVIIGSPYFIYEYIFLYRPILQFKHFHIYLFNFMYIYRKPQSKLNMGFKNTTLGFINHLNYYQDPSLSFKTYPNHMVYQNLGFDFFVIPALLFRFCLVGEPESNESPVIKVIVNSFFLKNQLRKWRQDSFLFQLVYHKITFFQYI